MGTTFTTADGRTLSYQIRGEGPPVICLAGGPGLDADAYFATMDLPGFQLVIPAPRGTGESSPPASDDGWRFSGYADDLEQLRIHLGLDRLTLYGSSHGGLVALTYACRSPERIDRLIVASAPLRFDDAYQKLVADQERRFVAAVPDGADRLAASQAASAQLGTAKGPAEFARLAWLHFSRYVATLGPAEKALLDGICAAPINPAGIPALGQQLGDPQFNVLAGADQVTAPALILAGELDVTTPPAQSQETASTLSDTSYVEFAGVGHFPEVEAPALFQETVTAFLA